MLIQVPQTVAKKVSFTKFAAESAVGAVVKHHGTIVVQNISDTEIEVSEKSDFTFGQGTKLPALTTVDGVEHPSSFEWQPKPGKALYFRHNTTGDKAITVNGY